MQIKSLKSLQSSINFALQLDFAIYTHWLADYFKSMANRLRVADTKIPKTK